MPMKKGFHKSIKIYFSMPKKTQSFIGHLSSDPSSTPGGLSTFKYQRCTDAAPATTATLDCSMTKDEASLSDSLLYYTNPPLSAIRMSERLFVSPGTTSGSLVEDARARPVLLTISSIGETDQAVPIGGMAVMTFSRDPYEDFRLSMQDMVDARKVEPQQQLDWDFLKELVLCYLELNDQCVHKYILRAFTDLTVSFRRR